MSPRSAGVAQILTGAAATLALLYYLRIILVPLVIAFVLAVLVNALVEFIRSHSAAAPGWAVASLTGLLVISVASAAVFALAEGAAHIVAQAPALMSRLDDRLGGESLVVHCRRSAEARQACDSGGFESCPAMEQEMAQ